MEPLLVWSILTKVLIYGAPFVAFFSGVLISDRLKLNGDLSRMHVWLMSVPVSFITIGNMLMIVRFETKSGNPETINIEYGYMNSLPNFLVFIGTLIFYGTLVPQLFNQIRGRIRHQK